MFSPAFDFCLLARCLGCLLLCSLRVCRCMVLERQQRLNHSQQAQENDADKGRKGFGERTTRAAAKLPHQVRNIGSLFQIHGLSANQLIVFCFLLNLPRSADSSALGHLLHLHLVCGKRWKFPASLVFWCASGAPETHSQIPKMAVFTASWRICIESGKNQERSIYQNRQK